MLTKISTPATERRKYNRVETSIAVDVLPTDSDVRESAEIVDSSMDGICLLLGTTVEEGQQINVVSPIREEKARRGTFEVRWIMPSGDRFLAGAKRIKSV